MSILNKTKTYLIGPIQYDLDGCFSWRDELSVKLQQMGIVVFNPLKKPFINSVDEGGNSGELIKKMISDKNFEGVRKLMNRIRAFDLRMVDLSDFIIGYINPNIPSWGTADELFTALRLRKPVFLVVEGGVENCPWWILGSMPVNFVYDSFDSVVNSLKMIDSGKTPIDDKYWRLLKPELR